ncbi:MAG: sn-glycerol-3-phosphate ABC transporter ATP-binding protein UgpC [Bacteroidetes bacterium]|nr:sn-glycerol-3-phosphate ABC transporter ATP-binding protein UgpC [Bacteroidota bacterium]
MSALELKSISKTYPGGIEAVKNVSLSVRDGEFLVLVGPSGCGKSTILRMIAGLEDLSTGEVLIGEKDVTEWAPKDRNVAMVFQNYALYPHMTVAQNIGFGLKLRGVSKKKAAVIVEDTARLLGLESELDRRPGELSGGQRQRVALGRAIVRNPEVFLFDEPLSNLDARLRSSVRLEIMKLHKNVGTTMVYVTHDQVEAMTMGDRIVVMNRGEVLQLDTPLNVYNEPATTFVATFIGSPPMNLFAAEIEVRGKSTFQIVDLELRIDLSSQGCFGVGSEPLTSKVKLGIRPEDIQVAENFDTDTNRHYTMAIECVVELVELLGNEVILHLNRKGVMLVVRTLSHNVPLIGSRVFARFLEDRISIFDSVTDKRLFLAKS